MRIVIPAMVALATSGCMTITHLVAPSIPRASVQAGGSVGDLAFVVGTEEATGTFSLLTLLIAPGLILLDYAFEAVFEVP